MTNSKLLTLALLLLITTSSYATNYTWTGTVSTAWTDTTNWSPHGTPGSSDNITVVTGSHNVYLSGNVSVAKFTITSGTVDLQSNAITITDSAKFTSGAINNGSVIVSNTVLTTFSGTTFGASVSVTSASILANGSIFNNTLTLIKKGSANDGWTVHNVFNASVTIIDSGSGAITTGSANKPDTFATNLTVKTASSGAIHLARSDAGNSYNGPVTFVLGGSGSIYVCAVSGSSAAFHDSLILNSIGGASGTIQLGGAGGNCSLDSGKNLFIGSGGFHAGLLLFEALTQKGNNTPVNLTLSDSASVAFSGGKFNSTIIITAPYIYFNGGRFNNKVSITETGGRNANPYSSGSSYFADTASFTNNSSGWYTMGAALPDTFATKVDYYQTVLPGNAVSGTIFLRYGTYYGSVTLHNANTSTAGSTYNIGAAIPTLFKNHLTISDTAANIKFGISSGTFTTLDTNSVLRFSSNFGFKGDSTIYMKNVTQVSTDTFPVLLNTSTKGQLVLDSANTFNGPFIFTGQYISLRGQVFNNSCSITRKNSPAIDLSAGSNVFNGTTVITDSSTGAHHMRLANNFPDIYNGNVTFNQKGASNTFIQPAYTGNSYFAGNIIVNDSNAAMPFGANGGKVSINGSGNQSLTRFGNAPSFKRIQVNKSGGTFTPGIPITLTTDSMILTKGIVLTDSVNLLTVPDNGNIYGGSDSSYINGPLKKIGNDAFTFPIGDSSLHSGSYHPLTITAPANTTDAFSAQYFAHQQNYGSGKVDSIGCIRSCEYWKLLRTAGTSSITATLGWNSNPTCTESIDTALERIAYFDSSLSKWTDLGQGTKTGNNTAGSLKATLAATKFGGFTLAKKCNLSVSLSSSSGSAFCAATADTLTATPSGVSNYQFFKNGTSIQNGSSNKLISASFANNDKIKVLATDNCSCFSSDSITLTIHPLPTAHAGADQTFCYGDSTTLGGSPTASGSTSPYTYSWNPTTALSNSSAANPKANPPSNTSYIVAVTDNYGCTAKDTVAILVNVKSSVPTSVTATSYSLCNSQSATLTLNGGGGGTSEMIHWYSGSCGTGAIGTGNTISVSPSSTTTYFGRYENNDACSYNTTCQSVIITVTSTPTWYKDADGDGYGNVDSSVTVCAPPSGYVSNNLDCNDNEAAIWSAPTVSITGITQLCTGMRYYQTSIGGGDVIVVGPAGATSILTAVVAGVDSSMAIDSTNIANGTSVYNWSGNFYLSDGLPPNAIEVADSGHISIDVDLFGCSASADVNLIIKSPVESITYIPALACDDGLNGSLQVNVTNESESLVYSWSTGETAQTIDISDSSLFGYINIMGDGYFIVQESEDTYAYTRNGQFSLDSSGRMIYSSTGYLLTPEITIPADARSVTIKPDGTVEVLTADSVSTTAGQIQIARFNNQTGLHSAGNYLYEETAISGAYIENYPGINGNGFLSQTADIYMVTVTDNYGCTSIITDALQPNRIPISGDTSFCQGTSITLDAGAGYNSYLWSNGATTQTTIIASATNAIADQLNLSLAGNEKPSDWLHLSINGSGYFVLKGYLGDALYYTKDGNFSTDDNGQIIHVPTGYLLQGLSSGGLSSSPIYVNPLDLEPATAGTGFDSFGDLLPGFDGVFSSSSGNPAYFATSVKITSDGIIESYNNHLTGLSPVIRGQIALATFPDSSQLHSSANNIYTATVGSGIASYDIPGGSNGTGLLNYNYSSGLNLSGDAYFVVKELDDLLYEHNGQFSLDGERNVVSASTGAIVQWIENGSSSLSDFTIPSGVDSIIITPNGTIKFLTDGSYQLAGYMPLARFANSLGLFSFGDDLYDESFFSGASAISTQYMFGSFLNHSHNLSVNVTDSSGCVRKGIISATELLKPDRPVITANGTTALCPGSSVTLNAPLQGISISDAIYYTSPMLSSYLWSTGATSEQITVSSAGSYYVAVSNIAGCTSLNSDTLKTTVFTVHAGIDKAICAGDSAMLGDSIVATGGNAPYIYQWNPIIALSDTAAANPKASPDSTLNYIVSVSDSMGCVVQDTVTITIHSKPIATISSSSNTTYGNDYGSATISITGGSTPYTYSWSNGRTDSMSTGLAAGVYSITVTDSNGCSALVTDTVKMIAFTSNKDTINVGDVLILNNVSIGFDSLTAFKWNYNDLACHTNSKLITLPQDTICVDTILGLRSAIHIFNLPGSYSVNLYSVSNGDSLIYSKTIFVKEQPATCSESDPCEYIYNGSLDDCNRCSPKDWGDDGTGVPVSPSLLGFQRLNCWVYPYALNNSASPPTPDYFSTYAAGIDGSNAGIPCNWGGSCPLRTGTTGGYAGIFTYASGSCTFTTYREYIQQKLVKPLTSGTHYQIRFWVYLADISAYGSDIGAYIFKSDNAPTFDPSQHPGGLMSYAPQLSLDPVTNDGGSWTKVSLDDYQAAGGENWIIIGNFHENANSNLTAQRMPPSGCLTQANVCEGDGSPINCAYYYIDDVSILEKTSLTIACKTVQNESCNVTNDGIASVSLLTSNPSHTYSYLWSNGKTTPVISNLAAAVYTVTVSDDEGDACNTATCSVTINREGSVDLTVAPPVAEISSFCSGDGVILTASGASTYTWSPSSTLSPTTGATVTASPIETTVYTVTGSNANGCSGTKDVTVQVNDETCVHFGDPFYEINHSNGILTDDTYTGTNQTLNCSVVVPPHSDGSPVIFENLDLLINSGVSITIQDGAKLSIHNSTLHACENMWYGIIVEGGGTLFISSGTIQDAQYAVEPLSTSIITINNCNFNEDFVGVYVPPNARGNFLSFEKIVNCSFTCNFGEGGRTSLPSGYSGQTPEVQSHTFAGIYINDINLFLLGDGTSFSDLNNGIYAVNSALEVNRCTFLNIDNYDTYGIAPPNPSPDPYAIRRITAGIYARGIKPRSLLYTGYGHNNSNFNFDNCTTGIYTEQMNTTIHGANINNLINQGIVVAGAINLPTDISGCNILTNTSGGYYDQKAIQLTAGVGSLSTNISDNYITMQDPTVGQAYGIDVSNSPSTKSEFNISGNYMYLPNTIGQVTGIRIIYAKSCTAFNNNIAFSNATPSPNTAFGIISSASPLCTLTCNNIYGRLPDNKTQYGKFSIYTYLGTNYSYKCNYSDLTFDGIYFANGISQGALESNSFGHNNYGLRVDKNGLMGPQDREGNSWGNPSYVTGAVHLNIYNNNFLRDLFRIGNYNLTSLFPSVSPDGWFIRAGGSDAHCGTPLEPTCPILPASFPDDPTTGGELTPMDRLIAEDSIHTTDFDEPLVWDARRNLMEKIMVDTNLISVDTSVAAFYNVHLGDNIGALTSIKLQIDALNKIDSSVTAGIINNLEIINSSISNITKSDSLLASFGDSLVSTAVIDSIISLIEDNKNYVRYASLLNDSIYNIIHTEAVLGAANIQSSNSSLSSSKVYEQNEITVNNIHLSTVAIGRMDSIGSYSSALYNIARQCALTGGRSVIYARSLYSLIDDSTYFDDDQICASPSDTCLVPPMPGNISGKAYSVCGLSINYTIDSMRNVSGYTWTITGNAAIDSGQGTTSLWVSFTDTFTLGTISVYATDSCGSGNSRILAVKGTPAAPASISGPDAVCAFSSGLTFSIDSVDGATNYSWIVPSGCTIDSGQASTKITVDWDTLPGNIIVVASNGCGAGDSLAHYVGITECRMASTHIGSSSSNSAVKLYPNPTTGKVTVIYQLENKNGVLQLFDVVGKLLKSYPLNAEQNRFEFDIADLCCGIFEYRIIDSNSLLGRGKVVILR